VLVVIPVVKLKQQLPIRQEHLVLGSAVTALAAEKLPIPPTTGLNVPHRDQGLNSHVRLPYLLAGTDVIAYIARNVDMKSPYQPNRTGCSSFGKPFEAKPNIGSSSLHTIL
jgi:hypothetical protein